MDWAVMGDLVGVLPRLEVEATLTPTAWLSYPCDPGRTLLGGTGPLMLPWS